MDLTAIVAGFVVIVTLGVGWLATERTLESNRIAAFDRRHAVFDIVHKVLSDIMRDGRSEFPHIGQLAKAYQDAQFLFSQTIVNYIDSIHKRVVELQMVTMQTNAPNGALRQKALDREYVLLLDIVGELSKVRGKFRPEIALRDWSAQESVGRAQKRLKEFEDEIRKTIAKNRAEIDA